MMGNGKLILGFAPPWARYRARARATRVCLSHLAGEAVGRFVSEAPVLLHPVPAEVFTRASVYRTDVRI